MFYISGSLVLPADSSGDLRPDGPLVGYRTRVTLTNISADEEAAGFPATNLANPSTAEKWKGTTTGDQTVVMQLAVPAPCDYVGIARHNLGSTQCSVLVQASVDGDVWNDLADEFVPADDAAIMVRFVEDSGPFFRLLLNPSLAAPSIAVLYWGQLLVLQRNIYVGHMPINLSYENVSSVGISESGEFLGAIARRANPQNDVKQANLTPDWVRAKLAPFYRQCVGNGPDRNRTPFFFAWRPTSYPSEIAFGWFPEGSPPKTNNAKSNGMMDASFNIQAIL